MSFVSMTIKVSPDFRDQFAAAEVLGISPSEALKILAQRFIDEGGFPFDVQLPQIHLDQSNPKIIQTYHKDGKLMMPAAWRDQGDRRFRGP